MQKTENYKQSEVGLIPEDWEVERLESLTLKIGSGITPTGGSSVYKQEGRPFLRSQNVGWGNLLLDDIVFIDEQTHMTFPSTEIKSGDVFLNITGASIGRSSYASKHVLGGNVNQHVCIIRPQQEKLTSLYLNHFLLSNRGQKQIDSFQSGGNRQGLNFGQIKTFLIPLPPLPEQTAIASALSDMDALIAQTEKLIEKKKAIKQGVMQELLTGKKRLKGFENSKGYKQTEVGLIPEDWEVLSIDNIFDFYSTSNYSKAEMSLEGEVGCIHYGLIHAISDTSYNLQRGIKFFIKPEQAKYEEIMDGDVVMVDASEDMEGVNKSIEVFGVNNKRFIAGLHTYLLRDNKLRLANNFRGAILNSSLIKTQLNRLAVGMKVFGVSKPQLKTVLIPVPPLPEQTAIASALSDIDEDIRIRETKLQKLKLQKQGMMQALLTGKIRLV